MNILMFDNFQIYYLLDCLIMTFVSSSYELYHSKKPLTIARRGKWRIRI